MEDSGKPQTTDQGMDTAPASAPGPLLADRSAVEARHVATLGRPEPFEPLFILGNPRSGTSTLAAMLDRHSQIAVPPENQFFSYIPAARRAGIIGDHERMVDFFLRGALWDLALDGPRVLERFRHDEPTCANFYRRALEAFAERYGKVRVGEKSIDHIYSVPQIAEAYPCAKFLFLARDGRDAVQAAVRTRIFSTTRRRSSHRWRSGVAAYLAARERYDDRMLLVRFEDLLRNPEEQLRRICDFIDLDYEDQVLDFSRPTASIAVKELGYKSRSFGKLDPSVIGEHQRKAGEREKWMMDSVLAGALQTLGYAPTVVRRCPWPIRAWDMLLNGPLFVLYHPALSPLRNRAGLVYHRLRIALRRSSPAPGNGGSGRRG